MRIKSFSVGPAVANCYVITHPGQDQAIVIDPGDDEDLILGYLNEQRVVPALVVNTHGHVDHIGANGAMKRAGARLCIHRLDSPYLTDPAANLSSIFPGPSGLIEGPEADELLDEGSVIRVGELEITVIHTPGHTPGGICLLGDSCVFTGDTLFAGSIGRTDLPGGDYGMIIRSLSSRLMTLPDETRVYPGHGPATTIGVEKRTNPFIDTL